MLHTFMLTALRALGRAIVTKPTGLSTSHRIVSYTAAISELKNAFEMSRLFPSLRSHAPLARNPVADHTCLPLCAKLQH